MLPKLPETFSANLLIPRDMFDAKYPTISFRYIPGEETRLFYRKDPRPVTEKAGFLRCSQKKRYIKNF
ncbi:Uncharacterized protein dnm_006910 [Desulfonema magnum]|uniref:Uncharacterized protein n=1 Tax=Desulfonema magnum TaxID=45655 RepID=A0A975BFY2_9BACT|nr:Uncharacterized protein dnm_006910 [Desulfonema magnum]